jgi:hypothetical protein
MSKISEETLDPKRGQLGHVALACAGSGDGSNQFGLMYAVFPYISEETLDLNAKNIHYLNRKKLCKYLVFAISLLNHLKRMPVWILYLLLPI